MKDPRNYDARADIMWASSLSHNDLTGCGRENALAVHQLEHALSGEFDFVAHGAGLSVLFPAWARYVYKANPSRFARFARQVWGVSSADDEEAAFKQRINKMYQEIVKQVEDKYKVKSEHPETEEEAKDFAAKVLKIKEEIPIPDNYEVWDDKGNVIHTSKIIIREKKKEYPKTYKECCKVLGIDSGCLLASYDIGLWKDELLGSLQKLLICRDAYWKVAGEEMGLGKPWEPSGNEYCFIISRSCGEVYLYSSAGDSEPFEFPTQEMRDAFKKNFDPDIEICKEFL